MAELARRNGAVLAAYRGRGAGIAPALTPDFPDYVPGLKAEHQRVEAVLGEAAAGTPADPAWPERLAEPLALLRERLFKEQDGFFPEALATLGGADWETAEAVRSGSAARWPAPAS